MRKALLAILLISISFACFNKSKDTTTEEFTMVDSSATKTVLLQVDGMTCEGCEMTISKAVGQIEGVMDVNASHTESLTSVVYDTSKVSIVLISEKIIELGYTVVGEIPQ